MTARFFILLLFATTLHATSPDDIVGVWDTGNGKVEIYKCDDHYCGKIVDLEEKVYPADDDRGMAGKPKVDRENPDQSKRSTPVMGLMIMKGFGFDGKIWSGGTIYDPENGKTYKCKMSLSNQKKLKVRGFIGISLIGRTEVWTR